MLVFDAAGLIRAGPNSRFIQPILLAHLHLHLHLHLHSRIGYEEGVVDKALSYPYAFVLPSLVQPAIRRSRPRGWMDGIP